VIDGAQPRRRHLIRRRIAELGLSARATTHERAGGEPFYAPTMKSSRGRSAISSSTLGAAALVVAALSLASCASGSATSTGDGVTASATSPTAEPTSTTTQTATDADSCDAFADVATILQNAMADLQSERMSQKEYDGWMRVATRILNRIPVSGTGDVSAAISELKAITPAVPAGSTAATEIGSPEWGASTSLAAACNAAGHPIAVQAFTGG
jgi:hypothetical protein